MLFFNMQSYDCRPLAHSTGWMCYGRTLSWMTIRSPNGAHWYENQSLAADRTSANQGIWLIDILNSYKVITKLWLFKIFLDKSSLFLKN